MQDSFICKINQMLLNIESPHFTSQKLESLIQSKFRHLEKLYKAVEDTSVVVRKVKDARQKNCEIEVKLLIPKKTLFVIEHAETFAEALDNVIKVLKNQLQKHKEELVEGRHAVNAEMS